VRNVKTIENGKLEASMKAKNGLHGYLVIEDENG
jgi:hypothetical protein